MKFAKIVFTIAGVWGLVVLTPLYFMFDYVGRQYPPPITHPDFFYGFLAITLAWQIGFLMIGREPARLRPMMIPAVLEKFLYVGTLALLYAEGRIQAGQFGPALPDFLLGCFFIAAFVKVRDAAATR